jgi:predicted phage terminase large subunit-like protein
MKPSAPANDREKLLASIREIELEKARISFWHYCCLLSPEFYNKSKQYLRLITDSMQEFIDSGDSVMIINAPPRHGKSWTACHLCEWLLGNKPELKIMVGSYNELLAETFSKTVRNTIETVRVDPSKIVYSDVFPTTKIKKGDGAVTRWSLAGQHATYLATSPTGTSTGFGANLLIIDDLIKNAMEAYNEATLDKQWEWFTNTMLSRLESGGKIIIIMTRWHTKDISGRAETHFNAIGLNVRKITLKALQDDGEMLCSSVLSHEDYKMRILSSSPEIVAANYQQEPIDITGKLYSSFKTYCIAPQFKHVWAYIDTADEGTDYLACIIYGIADHEAYILEVLYTQKPMDWTEPRVAELLQKYRVEVVHVESNSGGRGFARNIERLSKSRKNFLTITKWFHQSKNKAARILTNATWIMEHMYFPENWSTRWPEFFESMNTYQQNGKNAHDDAQDAVTGVAERITKRGAEIGPINVRL